MMLVAPWISGCGLDDGDGSTSVEEDIEQYESLKNQLSAGASVFVSGAAQDFRVAGNKLYWIDASVGAPRLLSYDDDTDSKLAYGFQPYLTGPNNPNPVDNLNYAATASAIASTNHPDSTNVYRAGVEQELLFGPTLPAPPYGQKWWAYALEGEALFVALTVDDDYVVRKWLPGSAQPADIANLSALIAPNVMGEFHNFAVSGDKLIFSEGARIWMVDLPGAEARWVQNDERATGADFDANGVVYSQHEVFWRYDWETDSRTELSGRMLTGYHMNATFYQAHHPTRDTLWYKHNDTIVYVANSGLFSFDMVQGTVRPVLLDERDNSRVYRTPKVLENGTLFVKSLESQSGSIGADGPTLRVAR